MDGRALRKGALSEPRGIQQVGQFAGGQADDVIAAAVIDVDRAVHEWVGAGEDYVGHVAAHRPFRRMSGGGC